LGWAEPHFYREATQRNLARYVRAVRDGGVGLIMPDYFAQDAAPSSGRRTEVEVPFGERRVLVHDFAGWLARTTGALVIPSEAIRDGHGRFRVRFNRSIDPAAEAGSHGVVTQRIFGSLSDAIVQNPERWNFLASYTPAPSGVEPASLA